MVKSGQICEAITVSRDATGALAAPSVGPVGALYVNGEEDAAVVTISGTNPYKWSVTLPTLAAGDLVQMYITATIDTVQTGALVWQDVADTAYSSEALRPTVAGRTLSVDASGAINSVSSSLQVAGFDPAAKQEIRDAAMLAPSAGTPAVGSIDTHLDDILEDTGSTLPALVSGLDGATVEVVSAVSGGTITVYVADTWRFTVLSDALSLDGYEKLGLVVKRGERATDNEALLYLRSDTGLIRIKGATPVSAANGSLVKTATSFTGVVAVAETQSVRAGQYQWWLKGFDTSPDPDEATTLAIGDFVLKTAGLQAVL